MRMRAWGFVKSQSFAFLRKRVFRVQFLLSLALGGLSQGARAGVVWDDLKSCMANPKLCVTSIQSSLSAGTTSIADMRRNFLLQYAILKNSPQLLAQLEDILGPLALSEADKLKIKQLQEKYAKVKIDEDPSKDDLKGFSKELVDILSHGNVNPELLAKISEPLESAGLLVHSQMDEGSAAGALAKEGATSTDFEKRIEKMAASGGEISNSSKANLVEEKSTKSTATNSPSDEVALDGSPVVNKKVASNSKGLTNQAGQSKNLEIPTEDIIPSLPGAPTSIPLVSSNLDGSTGSGGSADLVEENERSPASTSAKQVHGNGDSSSSSSSTTSSGGASNSAPIKGSGNQAKDSKGDSGTGTPSETASVDTQQNGLSQNNGTQDKAQTASSDSQDNQRHVSSDSGSGAKNTDTQERSTEDFKPKEDPTKVEPAKTGVAKTGVEIKGPETFKATTPEVKTAGTSSVFTQQFLDAQKSKELVKAFTSSDQVISPPNLTEGINLLMSQGNYQQAEALIRSMNPDFVEDYQKQKALEDEILHLSQLEKAGKITKEVLLEEVAKNLEAKEKPNNSREANSTNTKVKNAANSKTTSKASSEVSKDQVPAPNRLKKAADLIATSIKSSSENTLQETRIKQAKETLEASLKNPPLLNSEQLSECKLFYNKAFLGDRESVIERSKESIKDLGRSLDTADVKCENLKNNWRQSLSSYMIPVNVMHPDINPNYKQDLLYNCVSAYLKISAYNKLASSEADEYVKTGLKPITSYNKYISSKLAQEDSLEIQAKLLLVAEPEELLCASLIPEYNLNKQRDLGKVHDFYKCGKGARSVETLPLYFDKKAYEKRRVNLPLVVAEKNLNDQMIDDSEGVGLPVYPTSTNLTADGQFAKTAFMFNFFKTIEIENNQIHVPFKPFDSEEIGQRLTLLEASKRANLSEKLKRDRTYTEKLYELLYGSCSQSFVGVGDDCREILSHDKAIKVKTALTRANQRASRDLDKVKSDLLSPDGMEKIKPFRDVVVKNLCREREPASTSVHSK